MDQDSSSCWSSFCVYFSVLIWDDTQKDQDTKFMVEFILCLVFFSVDLG